MEEEAAAVWAAAVWAAWVVWVVWAAEAAHQHQHQQVAAHQHQHQHQSVAAHQHQHQHQLPHQAVAAAAVDVAGAKMRCSF